LRQPLPGLVFLFCKTVQHRKLLEIVHPMVLA